MTTTAVDAGYLAVADRAIAAGAIQKPAELGWFLERVAQANTGAGVLEIGADAGGTLQGLKEVSRGPVYGITLDGGPFSTGRPRVNHGAHVIVGDSHDPVTRDTLLMLHPEPFDVVLIDGDHSLAGVVCDWMLYSPLVRKGGFVALHDVTVHDPSTGCQVHVLWQWLTARWARDDGPRVESLIVEPHSWGGIGVAWHA